MVELALVTPINEKMLAAEKLAHFGFSVFQVWGSTVGKCDCGKVGCPHTGKHPHKSAPHGFYDATRKLDVIEAWWDDDPNANIGVATGNGLVVIDVDGPEGEESLRKLEQLLGQLPETLQVRTGKGRHLYFHCDSQIASCNGKWPKIDIKAESGYVIGPGSTHQNGATYQFVDESIPRAELPPAWLTALQQERPAKPENTATNSQGLVFEGRRNDYLSDRAYHYKKTGLDGEVLFQAVNHLNHKYCSPPLPDREVRDICNGKRNLEADPLPVCEVHKISGHDFESLCSQDFKDPEWIVKGLLPEGLTMLCGAPKTRKTWLAMDLALSVAQGNRVWGRYDVTEKRNVLYLGLEDTARRFQKRLKLILKGKQAPKNARFYESWTLDEKGREQLKKTILENDIGFVVVDTLSRARPHRRRSNGFAEDHDDVANLADISRSTGASIMVIHHTRKSESETDPFDEISGTRGLTAASDAMWVLKPRQRGASDYILTITGRDVEDDSLALRFDDYAWFCMGNSVQAFRNDTENSILKVINSTPLSPKEISNATGIKHNTVKVTLQRMVQDGLLVQQGRGKYVQDEQLCNFN